MPKTTDDFTKEQCKISEKNRIAARKHFGIYGKRNLVLHHKDMSLRSNDIERYILWLPEDLVILTVSEHSKLHGCDYLHKEEVQEKARKTLKERNALLTPDEKKEKYGCHRTLTNEQQIIAQAALINKIKDVTEQINKDGYKTRQQLFDLGVSKRTFYKEYELVYKIGQVGAYKKKRTTHE